jgi:hypothetical protein
MLDCDGEIRKVSCPDIYEILSIELNSNKLYHKTKHGIKRLDSKSLRMFNEYLVIVDVVTKFAPFYGFEGRL